MRFEISAELEVLRVSARTGDILPTTIPLRDWTLAAEKGRTPALARRFPKPHHRAVPGCVAVRARKPITRQPVLRFP